MSSKHPRRYQKRSGPLVANIIPSRVSWRPCHAREATCAGYPPVPRNPWPWPPLLKTLPSARVFPVLKNHACNPAAQALCPCCSQGGLEDLPVTHIDRSSGLSSHPAKISTYIDAESARLTAIHQKQKVLSVTRSALEVILSSLLCHFSFTRLSLLLLSRHFASRICS